MSAARRLTPHQRRWRYLNAPGRLYSAKQGYRLTDRQYRRLVKKSNGIIVRVKVGKHLQAVARTLYLSVPV